MRPVRLEMEGFASFRQGATVDFRETDFFVLVGPTGSGKSTVIDAMTFALYGTAPRWGKDNAVAPALAPTVNYGKVHLLFDAGGQRYVVARVIQRRSNGVGVTEARLERFADPAADGSADDETTPLATGSRKVTEEVTNLLGLTFEQFTKSVALPQGRFAEFLHATGAERQEILKNLLGYRIYDEIRSAAASRASDNETRAAVIGEQLAGYADDTPEAVASAADQLKDLRTLQIYVADTAIPALRTASGQAREARGNAVRLSNEQDMMSLVRMPAGIEELDTQKTTRSGALAEARTDSSRIETLDAEARAALAGATPRHEIERLINDWKVFHTFQTEWPTLETQAQAAAEVQAAAGAARTAAALDVDRAREASSQAEKAAEDQERALDDCRARLRAVSSLRRPTDIADFSRKLREAIDELSAAKAAHSTALSEQTEAASALASAPGAVALAEIATGLDELRKGVAEDLDGEHDRETEAAETVKAQENALVKSAAAADAKRAVHDAEHRNLATTLRAELSVGDDCPVCQQTVKTVPESEDSDHLHIARRALQTALDEQREADAKATRLQAASARSDTLREERLARCEASRCEVVELCPELDRGAMATPITCEAGSNELISVRDNAAEQLTVIRQRQRDREAAEHRRRNADQSVETTRGYVQSAEPIVESARADLSQAWSSLTTARDTVSTLGPPSLEETDIEQAWKRLLGWAEEQRTGLSEQAAALETAACDFRVTAQLKGEELASAANTSRAADQAADEATASATKASTQRDHAAAELEKLRVALDGRPDLDGAQEELRNVNALQARADELYAQFATARKSVEDCEKALADCQQAIDTSWQELNAERDPLTQFGAPPLTDQSLITAWELMVAWAAAESADRASAITAELARADAADQRAKTARIELVDELAKRELTVPEALSIDEVITQAPVTVAESATARAAAVERARERLEESQTMHRDAEAAREAGAVARTLAQLMHANKFPQWLIASALDTLLKEASTTLMEISGGQFELQRDGGDLVVIDHNDADMPRPVKTLSGGETFQASLALALALSSQVTALSAAGAKTLESILLDEGFGTLDEATLDVVACTLENLASSKSRMVGVITHVAALAERIPVRFEVRRDSAGSHIRLEQG